MIWIRAMRTPVSGNSGMHSHAENIPKASSACDKFDMGVKQPKWPYHSFYLQKKTQHRNVENKIKGQLRNGASHQNTFETHSRFDNAAEVWEWKVISFLTLLDLGLIIHIWKKIKPC